MALRLARPAGLTAALPARRVAARAAAAPRAASAEATFAKAATAAAAAATLLSAGNALAAQSVVAEVASAAGDGRGAILASLALPALGWVAFNMAEPTKNQIDAMASKSGGGKVARALAAGLGLAAAMSVASSADAATSVADVAASDNRLFIILGLFLPAIGWVLFNMAGPVLNQINNMAEKNAGAAPKGGSKRRSVAGAGLGAGLSAAALLAGANSADAVTNLGEIAASDNRLFIILGLFLPALGWVLFNMAGPVLNQINNMAEKNASTPAPGGRRARAAVGAGLGLSALLGATSSADAATNLGEIAASDNRLFIILGLFLPAIGWVLFNMAGPVLNQINNMAEKNAGSAPSSKGGKRR